MPAIESGNVCIFGAGGPLGAATARSLQAHYTLRLADIRDVHEILNEDDPRRRRKRAPQPSVPQPPHMWARADVADYGQVLEAARGMDALINATVVRQDPVEAFRVNMVGAYNVMKAAAACGIRRVIHTGPRHTRFGFEWDYGSDFDIPDDAPIHAGANLYGLSKQLGAEVARVFAERCGIEVLCFLYCAFRPADGGTASDGSGVSPLAISWEDAGESMLYALRAPTLPRPFEIFNMCARLPHGKYGTEKEERLLGWGPKHNFERLYRRER